MKQRGGFTIVELLMIIAVISILTSIAIVGYGSWQRRIATKSVESDLLHVKSAMKNSLNFTNTYPTTLAKLNETFSPSSDVNLSMSSNGALPHYTNLSVIQNSVLFYEICDNLIAAGYARGMNNGGQTEQYITACNVYNNNQLQVNSSWTPRSFSTSVSATVLPTTVSSINYNDSWRPNRTQIEKDFYQTWHTRFSEQGGTYPITSFWDAWANQNNGGVVKQTLPPPDSLTSASFCVQANSKKFTTIIYHVTNENDPQTGPC